MGGDLEALDAEGETGVSVLLPLHFQRGLQSPTHSEGQLCLVLVGIKSIMPEEMNFSSLFCILLHRWTHPICLGPKERTVKMTERESLIGLCLEMLASLWGLLGGGTPGQPAWHLGQVAPMAKREEGRSNANSGQGGFGHPISCLI